MTRSCCSIARKGGANYCGVCGRDVERGVRSRLRIYWHSIARAGLCCFAVASVSFVSFITVEAEEGALVKGVGEEEGGSADVRAESQAQGFRSDAESGREAEGEANQRVAQLLAQWRPAQGEDQNERAPLGTVVPPVRAPTSSHSGASVIRPMIATASSHTVGSRVVSYAPSNAVDNNLDTGWQVSDGGIGEWIQLDFGRQIPIERLGVVPGYDKRRADRVGDRFFANNRVAQAVIEWDGGSVTHRFDDDRRMQFVELGGVSTSWVRITITAVNSGARWNDTVISEIRCEGLP